MGKIVAIIQARLNSTRLPGKVLLDIDGRPVLSYVLTRMKRSKLIDEVVLATTLNKEDDDVAALGKRLSVGLFRGSEHDVLDRYYQAAKTFKGNIIVRVTGEDPLIDPKVVDSVVDLFISSGAEYATNILPRTFPVGMDTEVFSFKTLEKVHEIAKTASHKEHVTAYIRDNIKDFKVANIEAEGARRRPDIRFTIDYESDLKFMRSLFKRIKEDGLDAIALGIDEIFDKYKDYLNK